MALLVFEGFEHLPSGNAISSGLINRSDGIYTHSGGGQNKVSAVVANGSAVQHGGSSILTITPGSSYGTLIVGLRYKTCATFVMQDFLRFRDSTNVRCGLSFNASGNLIIWRGTNATVLATGSRRIPVSTTVHIEAKILFDASAGSFTVNLDGTQELNASSQNTSSSTTVTNVQIGDISGTSNLPESDSIYIMDTSGGAPLNDMFNDSRIHVETLFPTSNNAVQWTPNASTNVSRVQDTTGDGDTTYNSSSTTNHVDTFNHGSLTLTPSTIYAAQTILQARKDDVTTRNLRHKLISNVTTGNGSSRSLVTTYQLFYETWLTDPDTAAAWANAAAINATKIGYEHL